MPFFPSLRNIAEREHFLRKLQDARPPSPLALGGTSAEDFCSSCSAIKKSGGKSPNRSASWRSFGLESFRKSSSATDDDLIGLIKCVLVFWMMLDIVSESGSSIFLKHDPELDSLWISSCFHDANRRCALCKSPCGTDMGRHTKKMTSFASLTASNYRLRLNNTNTDHWGAEGRKLLLWLSSNAGSKKRFYLTCAVCSVEKLFQVNGSFLFCWVYFEPLNY